MNIDGTTAPGFAGTPVVEVNFNNFGGLQFNVGAKGSALRSLALVDASGNGVTLTSVQDMLIVGNFIGLSLDGVTAAGNSGDGIELVNSSRQHHRRRRRPRTATSFPPTLSRAFSSVIRRRT